MSKEIKSVIKIADVHCNKKTPSLFVEKKVTRCFAERILLTKSQSFQEKTCNGISADLEDKDF